MFISTTTSTYEFGAVWLTLAIVVAGLAETKGRRRWTWFVLGLLLGPIAAALVVCWPRPASPSQPRSAGAPQ